MGMIAITNIAALRQLSPAINESVFVMGENAPNDGGAGMYIFIANSPATDNGTTIIRSMNGTGCWFLNLANSPSGSPQYDGPYVLAGADPYLPNARVITAGSNITITDNGPGGTLVIASAAGGVSTATLPLIITASNIALGTAQGPTTPDATSSVTWSPSGAASTGLVLQAIAAQSVPMMEVQTSTGAVCFSLPVPTGTLTGTNNNIIGINAGDGLTSGSRNFLAGTDAGGAAASGAMSDCVFIGHQAGLVNTGDQNIFIGSSTGDANVAGVRNVFIGYTAGGAANGITDSLFIGDRAATSLTSGNLNTIVGASAGGLSTSMTEVVLVGTGCGSFNTGTGNVFIGKDCGQSNTSSTGATYVGYKAGISATGADNTIVGYLSGDSFTTGTRNCLFGKDAGGAAGATGMSDNCFFGYQAGLLNTADQNTFFGSTAGNAVTTGTLNTLIGYNSDVAATEARTTCLGANTSAVTDSTAIGNGATATATSGIFVSGSSTTPMDQVFFGKGYQNASATAYAICGTGGSGSDNAGADLRLAGGRGTGLADGGLVVVKYPLRSTTGSTLQSLSTQSYTVSTTMFTGNISNVTVTASVVNTTETTVIGSIIGSQSLEGGLLRVGRLIRLTVFGQMTTSAVPVTFNFRFKKGSTVLNDTGAFTPVASLTNVSFEWQTTCLIRTLGAPGTGRGDGVFTYYNSITGAVFGSQGATAPAISTTTTENIDATIQFGGNTAGNNVIVSQVMVEILN